MEETNDIDADGYWTIDNYEALTGLWAYHWLARQIGNTSEANWAAAQYSSLLKAVNKTLDATISANHLNYLPCSMTSRTPTTAASTPRTPTGRRRSCSAGGPGTATCPAHH